MKEYSKGIYVKFKPEEVEILHDRMKEAGVQNMSAYIRKMAINGYVIIPEWPDLNRVISLHARISNNLNQYAKKATLFENHQHEHIGKLAYPGCADTQACFEESSQVGQCSALGYRGCQTDLPVFF